MNKPELLVVDSQRVVLENRVGTWRDAYIPKDRDPLVISDGAKTYARMSDNHFIEAEVYVMNPVRNVVQNWVSQLPLMQQGVLLLTLRGADGSQKYDTTKYLLRWYRRCVLNIAFGNFVCDNPIDHVGGSFSGPSVKADEEQPSSWEKAMQPIVDDFIRSLDALPHHFVEHFRLGIEVLGYKHPSHRIRFWWFNLYQRIVNDSHLRPETEADMDYRLSDDEKKWRKMADRATVR